MPKLSRRRLLQTAARLGVGAALSALGLGGKRSSAQEEQTHDAPYFRESASKLTLGNRYYEVDFDRRNGAITRIYDKRGGGVVSEGNADRSLWAAYFSAEPQRIGSSRVQQANFRANWDGQAHLSMNWDFHGEIVRLSVRVDIETSDSPWFDLTARVQHEQGPRLDGLSFPNHLRFTVANIKQALITKLPGTLLQRSFFELDNHHYTDTYPGGTQCGDLTWVDCDAGSLATYAISPGPRAPIQSGYRALWQSRPAATIREHVFSVGAEAPGSFQTPSVRISIGELLPAVIADYRRVNLIDTYPSLEEKLGDLHGVLLRSPQFAMHGLHAVDWARFQTFAEYADAINDLAAPGILQNPAFTELEFDRQNPDWWPPDPRLGGVQGYRDTFGALQRQGYLVMPYINPTWWNPGTPSETWLSERGTTLEDLAVIEPDGTVRREEYAYWDPVRETFFDFKPGVVISPSDSRAQERLAYLMNLHHQERSDLIYLDQIGARPWIWDYAESSPSPRAYSDLWFDFTKEYRSQMLTTESGDDRVAETVVAFMSTMLTWDQHWKRQWGEVVWEYYPLSSMMVRDKVLLYQVQLAGTGGPEVTESLDMLRWSLAYGHQLNFDLQAYHSPWLPVVTAFAYHVLGPYADEQMYEWSGDLNSMTISRFANATVTANWAERPVDVGDHTLVPGGVVSMLSDGSITGGVFQRFNSHVLSSGEHYLIEQRKSNGVVVRQPMGSDTSIVIASLSDWEEGTSVQVAGVNRKGDSIGSRGGIVRSGGITFSYQNVLVTEKERQEFVVEIRLGLVNEEDGIVELAIPDQTVGTFEHLGRPARRPLPVDQWRQFAFGVDRRIVPDGGGDVTLKIEYFDAADVGDSLNVTVDTIDDPERPVWHWGGAETGNRTWKTLTIRMSDAVFSGRLWGRADFGFWLAPGFYIGSVRITNADELERRTVAYYTIHDPAQGETLSQGLHLRGWTDATQPIADLNLDGLQAIYAWDADAASWQMYSPDISASANTLDQLEQGRAYYVRVRNGQTLHWPDAPYGGVGFHLQPGRNLVCWLGTPDKPLTDAIAPLRGMKAEPLVSVKLNGRTYDVEESRSATEPLAYGQALWVEIDAVGPTRWLQF